jgi:2-polyprenyl-3-methyl-5-hydroxy-6-metoxy-1,4-benzoquinol methylase
MKTLKDWIIATGLKNRAVINSIPVFREVARQVYRWMPSSEAISAPRKDAVTGQANEDYASLSAAQIKKLMNERYSKEEAYVVTCLWDKVRTEELNTVVINMFSPTVDKRILEVGAGIGGSAAYISKCKEFVGTDVSEVAVSQARQTFGNKPNFSFLTMDAMDLKLDEDYFDVVIAKEVIEHLPEPQRAIREAFSVLRHGGLLVVTSPNRDSLHLRVNRMLGYPDFKCSFDHVKEFTFGEVVEMLTEEGFRIKDTAGVFLQPYWGIHKIDDHVRHLTDNDPRMVEMLRDLGKRAGAEYAFCFVVSAIKP